MKIIFTMYTKNSISALVGADVIWVFVSYWCKFSVGACVLWVHASYGCMRPMGARVLWVHVSHGCTCPMGARVLWVHASYGRMRRMDVCILWVPVSHGCLSLSLSSSPCSLKWENVQKELEGFAVKASSCQGGRISIQEFARFLKLPISPALEELFALFDRVRSRRGWEGVFL